MRESGSWRWWRVSSALCERVLHAFQRQSPRRADLWPRGADQQRKPGSSRLGVSGGLQESAASLSLCGVRGAGGAWDAADGARPWRSAGLVRRSRGAAPPALGSPLALRALAEPGSLGPLGSCRRPGSQFGRRGSAFVCLPLSTQNFTGN